MRLPADRTVQRTFRCAGIASSAGINLVFAGLTLVVVASQTARGTASVHLGIAFGVGAVGGLLGALATARVQRRLRPSTLIYGFGWTVALALVALGLAHHTYAIGLALGVVYFVTAPANAMLFAAQIHITPPDLQGRVVSAALLTIGIAAPLGPLLGGLLVDHVGSVATFAVLATVVVACTVAMQLSTAIRTMPRPGEN